MVPHSHHNNSVNLGSVNSLSQEADVVVGDLEVKILLSLFGNSLPIAI